MNKNEIEQRAKIALARKEFWYYCKLKAPDFYQDDRTYLKDMCYKLQTFIESDKRIMVINLPPRHGKSRTSTLLVQWLLGKDNKRKIMTGSYNETLSGTFAKQVRDSILEEDGTFSKVFPTTKIKYGEASMNKWALQGNEEANYLATSPTVNLRESAQSALISLSSSSITTNLSICTASTVSIFFPQLTSGIIAPVIVAKPNIVGINNFVLFIIFISL